MKFQPEEVTSPTCQQRPPQQTVTGRPGLKFSQLTQIYGEKKNTNGSKSSLTGDETKTTKTMETGDNENRRVFVTPVAKKNENHFSESSDEWLLRRKSHGTIQKLKKYFYCFKNLVCYDSYTTRLPSVANS
jgi:hypothetical protein